MYFLNFEKDIVPAYFVITRHLVTVLLIPRCFLLGRLWILFSTKKKENKLILRVTGAEET